MEPREVLALYDGYEWRRRREAGMLAFLLGQVMSRIELQLGLTPSERIDVDRLVKAMESWQPKEPK